MLVRSIAAALILVCGNYAYAGANAEREPSRGELLYTTYCVACHTAQVHWRDKKLVTDWSSLQLQIRRWQAIAGLAWRDADVEDVARYLNTIYYHYAAGV